MMPILKRYRAFLISLLAVLILTFINKSLGKEIIGITSFSLKEMIQVIPPIFLLLGLLDVWVPKETMTKFMGEGSGLKGILLAMFIGSAAAGPLYGAFPVAAVFMKKGVSLKNILIFIGAWSTTKIPLILFEPKFHVVLRKPLKIDIFAEPTKNSSSYSYILTLFTPLPQHI
jgi:uncharacterized membrane protein YraQ (UPF0718 family)